MNAFAVLQRHYDPSEPLYQILVVHSVLVARKARQIARDYLRRYPDASINIEFVTEAALLHDIGVKECRSEKIHSTGKEPYVCHGVLGAEILKTEELPQHALVCERHVGVGISKKDVIRQGLPIPAKDYLPTSIEEKIICVADKFFSKNPTKLWKREKPAKIAESLARYGPDMLSRWKELRHEVLGR